MIPGLMVGVVRLITGVDMITETYFPWAGVQIQDTHYNPLVKKV